MLPLVSFGHVLDLCGIGRDGTNQILNSNFTYQGTPTSGPNAGKPYWYSSCWDVALEWGVAYGVGDNYVFKTKGKKEVSFYAKCDSGNDADLCSFGWSIYESSVLGYVLDTQYQLTYCVEFTVRVNYIYTVYIYMCT